MKLIHSFITVSLIYLIASLVPATMAGPQVQQCVPLSAEEAEMLTFMREEEKLARDVYILMFDTWDNQVFYNISLSEQRHMDTMEDMLLKHNLPDPVVDDTPGEFTNTVLDALYKSLTDLGLEDPVEALFVGAKIEEKDIRDIQIAIEGTNHDDLIRAYENLMRGSRNHLRAFVRQIENLGIIYQEQVLEDWELDEIVDSPVERGPNRLRPKKNCDKGNGKGKKKCGSE